MAVDMHQFLERLNRCSGATDAAIAESERQLCATLPAEYAQFLKLTNGGEGFIGKSAYLLLWSIEELASTNWSYEVQKYAPGLLLFGSDGGGEAYGFDIRNPQAPIVQVPFVGMDWSLARPMGETFSSFLKRLHESE
jgi:SMI1 / KNR4 family (SUKH-1)